MKPVKTMIAVLLLVVACGAVIHQELEETRIGYDIGRMERELESVREQNRRFQVELSRQLSYQSISGKVKAFNLALVPPTDGDASRKS